MMTFHRRSIVAVVVGALGLTACSSSSSGVEISASDPGTVETASATDSAVNTEPTTTAESLTPAETTVPPVATDAPTSDSITMEDTPADSVDSVVVDDRPIDEAARELAVAMTLQSPDFGESWVVLTEAEPFAVSPDQCSYRPEGAMSLLPNGATQRGPMMQVGTALAFLSSSGLAFPDDAGATRWWRSRFVDVASCLDLHAADPTEQRNTLAVHVAILRTVEAHGENIAFLLGHARIGLAPS